MVVYWTNGDYKNNDGNWNKRSLFDNNFFLLPKLSLTVPPDLLICSSYRS